jgi:hypothetical protein
MRAVGPALAPALVSLLAAGFALLTGCAARGDFPSLAPRPIERELAVEQPAPKAPEPAADPALAARIAELLGQARAGSAAFETALAAARGAAAGAGAAGSDGWIAAQAAVSRVEAARTEVVTALAELDRIGIERARQPTSAADRAMVTAALNDVQAIADRQHEQLDKLRALLSPA